MSFEGTLTVGRQNLFLHRRDIRWLRVKFGLSDAAADAATPFGGYADGFLRAALGVLRLETLDASDYEGATLIHDLNAPLPAALMNTFDAVIEAGTLEHIFNVPVALTSLMRAVKVGGGLYAAMPANNLCGHGFYQFSPELMFRVLSEENGYETRSMVLVPARFPSVELRPGGRSFSVRDPEEAHERIGLMDKRAATLIVSARRTSDVIPFAKAPIQSDYEARWEGGNRHGGSASSLRLLARGLRQRRRDALTNRKHFTRRP